MSDGASAAGLVTAVVLADGLDRLGTGRCRDTTGASPRAKVVDPFILLPPSPPSVAAPDPVPLVVDCLGGTDAAVYRLYSYLSRINFSTTRTGSPSFGRETWEGMVAS